MVVGLVGLAAAAVLAVVAIKVDVEGNLHTMQICVGPTSHVSVIVDTEKNTWEMLR